MTQLKFLDHHRPRLDAGTYTLTITQTVDVTDAYDRREQHTFTTSRTVQVAGPRYHLPPDAVATIFPPADSTGDHALVMPHVTLTRSTLPWERSADGEMDGPPWLAILLVDDSEMDQIHLQTIPRRALHATARPEATVRVLDAQSSFLHARLPQSDTDLTLLCHVRKNVATGNETAVVLSTRLPHGGEISHAFLVSVEHCYPAGSKGFNAHHTDGQGRARLIVLKSWRFTCGDPKHALARRLTQLDHTPMTLQSPAASNHPGPTGASLVGYRMRDGSRTAAFYRGPLLPGPAPRPPAEEVAGLPALRSPDGLIRYVAGLGVFDVTYAAAWELGRLLALSTGSFAEALIRWKHHAKSQARQAGVAAAADHLPFLLHTNAEDRAVPAAVTTFLKKLIALDLVPMHYLLPDPNALPLESIRFFQVDPYWVRCLVEGALSIGRYLSNDHEHEVALREELDKEEYDYPAVGFLLRSDVVEGYPGLVVEGSDRQGNTAALEWRRTLTPGTLFCASHRSLESFVLHPAPEELHCGFADTGPRPVRDGTGAPTATRAQVYQPDNERVLHISSMRDALDGAQSTQGAGFFAFQMVQGVEHVRYDFPGPAHAAAETLFATDG